jgi:hypothetical protein
VLTDEHPACRNGYPVVVLDKPVVIRNGNVYQPYNEPGQTVFQPEDLPPSSYIHKLHIGVDYEYGSIADNRRKEAELRAIYPDYPLISYTPEEEVWMQDLYVDHIVRIHRGEWGTTFSFGASWQKPNTLAQAEAILGKTVPLA